MPMTLSVVILLARLLHKKAVREGLKKKPHIQNFFYDLPVTWFRTEFFHRGAPEVFETRMLDHPVIQALFFITRLARFGYLCRIS